MFKLIREIAHFLRSYTGGGRANYKFFYFDFSATCGVNKSLFDKHTVLEQQIKHGFKHSCGGVLNL